MGTAGERSALNLWKLDNLYENILTRYILLYQKNVDFPNPSNELQSYEILKVFPPLWDLTQPSLDFRGSGGGGGGKGYGAEGSLAYS